MTDTKTRMTVEEYFATEIDADWAQLIDGEIVVSHPRVRHAVVQARVVGTLFAWSEAEAGRGVTALTTDVVLDEYNAYGPDVLWIAEAHRPSDADERLARVPDLCVEVRSPSTWHYDVGVKKSVYERGGLPELWLVDDVAEVVLVFRRANPDGANFDVTFEVGVGDELTSPQLPGFALALEDLFRR